MIESSGKAGNVVPREGPVVVLDKQPMADPGKAFYLSTDWCAGEAPYKVGDCAHQYWVLK